MDVDGIGDGGADSAEGAALALLLASASETYYYKDGEESTGEHAWEETRHDGNAGKGVALGSC